MKIRKRGQMAHFKTKLISAILTLSVVIPILLLGPAQALISGFTIDNPFPKLGQMVNFLVSAEVESGEVLDIKNFTITLTGPIEYFCTFDPDGAPLTACPGASIQKLSMPDEDSFGYGFLPGLFRFNFSLDSSVLQIGTYDTMLAVTMPGQEMKTIQQQLIVQDSGPEVFACSLRAKKGLASLDEEPVANNNPNKLSLFVPGAGAVAGQGSITAGSGNNRAVYNFDVTKATQVDAETIIFETSGELRVGRDVISQETATLAFNKASLEIDVNGNALKIFDMDVNFARC